MSFIELNIQQMVIGYNFELGALKMFPMYGIWAARFVIQIQNLQLVQDDLGAKLIDKRHVHLAPPLLFLFHFHADTQSSRRAPTTSISTSTIR